MSNDPYPLLLFPTCAEAGGIGLSVPELLWDLEDACGPDVIKAVVLAFGGREISLSGVWETPFDRDPVQTGREWLRRQLGKGNMLREWREIAARLAEEAVQAKVDRALHTARISPGMRRYSRSAVCGPRCE